MTQAEIKAFLGAGAIIRLPSGKVRIWTGPFERYEFRKSEVFSVACMDFFNSQSDFYRTSQMVIETEVSELRAQLQSWLDEEPFPVRHLKEPSFELFQEAFQNILGRIHRGELEKAVPVVFSESALVPSQSQRARMLHHLLEAHPELYVFGFWNETSGTLGATPEILFHLNGPHLKTMALAGTRPLSLANELLKDPKELKEHRFVIQDLQERLEKFGWVRVEETHVATYGSIAHLRTWLEVDTLDLTVDELMKRLHPTAALGVFPRNYGLSWLKSLPYQEHRGIFGAPIVFSLSRQETLALVAIRCLQWNENGTRIGSGCGLVETSDLQREWQELTLKRQSVLKSLGLSL